MSDWHEELGRAVACELDLEDGSAIEHQCGTVFVARRDGTIIAISGMETEE